LKELGVDVVAGAQRGIVAPPDLPRDIEDRLTAAFAAALREPAFLAEAQRVQMPVAGLVGGAYRQSMFAIDARVRDMWKRKPWQTK
jgi:tripartite-type tricarboxylate transporter receptor subunit TctC